MHVSGNGPDPVIQWDRPKLERFKVAYKKAKGETFTFEGHTFLKAYAKYLIEFLDANLL